MSTELLYFVSLADGSTWRHCWVNKRVKLGDRITLKNSDEPDRFWEVKYVSTQAKTRTMLGEQSAWHVGGL